MESPMPSPTTRAWSWLDEPCHERSIRDGETLRSLVEQGLRKVVAERSAKTKPFKLQDCSFGTPGGPSEYEKLSWDEKRALMYEGRGG